MEQTDELHLKLNIFSTKEILRRGVELFGNEKFKNISKVSPSHINNLRKHVVYKHHWINQTKPKIVGIYSAQFRIWIPNDNFPSETRISTNNLPWSNQIAVELVDDLPSCTPLTTTTINNLIVWYTSYRSNTTTGDLNCDNLVNIDDLIFWYTLYRTP